MPEPSAQPSAPASDTMPYAAAEDLTVVRAFVRSSAAALGLPADRIDLLALAVSELATNTLQHTDGGGTVRLWASAGQVVCDVLDAGPMRSFAVMPPPHSVRGRGLAIVERIVDEVTATVTPDGTLIRMRMNL